MYRQTLCALAAWCVALPAAAQSREELLRSTEFVRGIDETSLVNMVPEQSGLNFVGCPNCNGGRQEGQLAWSPEHPAEVYCRYCNQRYPSDRYPMRNAVVVRNPRGQEQRYPYWEDAAGYRYFFAARRDDLARAYLSRQARDLAHLYTLTGDRTCARRAALLLERFAQVFPGWCYHYDYPFQQKIIYDGDVPPAQFRTGYRTARWTWWAYMDIPLPLVEAYAELRGSGMFDELSRERGHDVAAQIERDLFRNAAAQVLANPESLSNMSPTAWYSLIRVGSAIGERSYAEECARRLRAFVASQFFYDGVWHEGAPSYHEQTLGGLRRVVGALGAGYDDIAAALQPVEASLLKMRLPDGRFVPVHDTWTTPSRRGPTDRTDPYLLPALGHACLGGGSGAAQQQFHLTWSGGYGHEHGDNLSLLVFSHGRELLSDLGYSHTRYRSWTLATVAHNTVVMDGESQVFGSRRTQTDGSLRLFDVSDPRVQVVSADGERAYPGRARVYRRTLVVIDAGQDRRYAVDIFEVEGGHTHDYFLHGDADRPGKVRAALEFEPLATLVPSGIHWTPTRNEGETRRVAEPGYAYGFLRNLRSAKAAAGKPLRVDFDPGLRVTLLPEPSSRLVLGDDPNVRGAHEDDARLEEFLRPFLMLRHEGAHSRFVAIIEPYADRPFVDGVELSDDSGLRVRIGNRTDRIDFGDGIRVTSTRKGAVEQRYWSGLPRHAPLRAAERDALILDGDVAQPPARDQVVRMITADGWVYPYTVAAIEPVPGGLRLRVAESTGFAYDAAARRIRFTSFPQREHDGAVRVEWMASGIR